MTDACGTGFYRRWQQTNDWLACHESFWRPVPFMAPDPPWRRQHPQLAEWLETLPDDDCAYLEEHLTDFAKRAAAFVPGLAAYDELVQVPRLSSEAPSQLATLPEAQAVDMPGRKRLQAGAFASAVAPMGGQVLDWCSGKGHLARTLARQGAKPVVGFEWNPMLVADGNRLARHYGDPVQLQHQNVMVTDLPWPDNYQGVALHACGDLHRQLLCRASAARAPRLALSPCCYQRTDARQYEFLSQQTRDYGYKLVMDRAGLRLAVQETVTAPQRERKQGERVRAWRLGFDQLQRWLRGQGEYLPVPSHPPRLNNGDFEGFCRWAADKKGLDLPSAPDWSYWLQQGQRRLRQVRRHELLRHLFRRPIELWLVLDYAVFLEEQGYEVRLGTFCERSLTPRNLLLDAIRSGS